MKTMSVLMALLLSSLVSVAYGDMSLLYYVTFENPPHVVGEYVTTSGSPDGPSDGNFSIANVPLMGSQAAVPGHTMLFDNLSAFVTSGVHSISWDWALLEPDPNENLQCNVTLWGLGISIVHLRGNEFRFSYGGADWSTSYVENVVYHYALSIDMDSHLLSFSINGDVILEDAGVSGTDFDEIAFYRPYGTAEYAVDNFRWEVVPEPGANALLGLGGMALAVKLWHEKHHGRGEKP